MDDPKEIFIEAGLRFNSNRELEPFGIDDINAALAYGYQLRAMEQGRALMMKAGGDDDSVKMNFNGFSLVAIMYLPDTETAGK
jgi:hypothetical protein